MVAYGATTTSVAVGQLGQNTGNLISMISARGGQSGRKKVALGRDQYLDRFARRVGGSIYKNWLKDGLITIQDFRNYPTISFWGRDFPAAMNNADEVHFTLQGLGKIDDALVIGARKARYTEGELYEILHNRAWYNKTTFYDANGNIIFLRFRGN